MRTTWEGFNNEIPKFINHGSIRLAAHRNYKRIMVVSCCTDIVIHRITRDSIYDSSCITS